VTTGSTQLAKGRCFKLSRPWLCSLDHEHEGPCSATRDPNVSEGSVHVECPTYTDYQPGFGLYKEQREAIDRWIKEHDAARHIQPGRKFRYAGAIGGAYTFQFTSTTLGTCTSVRCSCGETLDVSDYSEW